MSLVVMLVCAALGAADQYVGSLTRFWPIAWQVPALSAPWLLLPFALGMRERHRLRAALLGGCGTLAGLVGYGLMTVSPVEKASFTAATFLAFARSNVLWFAAATVTGPLFGWLGHRWRVTRSRPAAAAVAGAVLLEPFVHSTGYPRLPLSVIPFGPVTATEFVLGLVMAIWFFTRRLPDAALP